MGNDKHIHEKLLAVSQPRFSDKIYKLMHKAQIVSFETWGDTLPEEAIQYFEIANEQNRYLTDEDLLQIQNIVPVNTVLMSIMQHLRDNAHNIVSQARIEVLETFPNITQPGGQLYPSNRLEACWRDFWQFLRCISYGIAGEHTSYTSVEGLHYLKMLYQELEVPSDAMVIGLEAAKKAILRQVPAQQHILVTPYFEHLIEKLKEF